MGKLVLFLADGTTVDIPLDRGSISIGRRTGNDVCLPYPAVSGNHAVIVTLPGGSVLEDLGSTNGTHVNRKRIAKHFLHDGDNIDVGRQKLIYFADATAVAPVAVRRSRDSSVVGDALARRGPTATDGTLAASALTGADAPVHTNATVRLSAADLFADGVAEKSGADATRRLGFAARGPANTAANHERAGETRSADEIPKIASPYATLSVRTGPSAGRNLSLDKKEMLIGRIGLQVAAVCKESSGFRVMAAEGIQPKVNGVSVPANGVLLSDGDVIELAGAQLTYLKA